MQDGIVLSNTLEGYKYHFIAMFRYAAADNNLGWFTTESQAQFAQLETNLGVQKRRKQREVKAVLGPKRKGKLTFGTRSTRILRRASPNLSKG
jgi:hypothetical protein